jgi:hypothetical protein
MDANTIAKIADACWTYAKSSGHHPITDAFERWFKNRARQLYALTDSEVSQVWQAALKMHS